MVHRLWLLFGCDVEDDSGNRPRSSDAGGGGHSVLLAGTRQSSQFGDDGLLDGRSVHGRLAERAQAQSALPGRRGGHPVEPSSLCLDHGRRSFSISDPDEPRRGLPRRQHGGSDRHKHPLRPQGNPPRRHLLLAGPRIEHRCDPARSLVRRQWSRRRSESHPSVAARRCGRTPRSVGGRRWRSARGRSRDLVTHGITTKERHRPQLDPHRRSQLLRGPDCGEPVVHRHAIACQQRRCPHMQDAAHHPDPRLHAGRVQAHHGSVRLRLGARIRHPHPQRRLGDRRPHLLRAGARHR